MDSHDFIPFLVCHLLKGIRADDTRVRDECVHTTERVQRRLDDRVAVLSGNDRGDGLTARYEYDTGKG